MSAPVDDLEQRVQDASDELMEIMPAAITLAMMFRHRKMSSWFRTEFEGYDEGAALPDFRRDVVGHIVAKSPQYGWIPAPVNDKRRQNAGAVLHEMQERQWAANRLSTGSDAGATGANQPECGTGDHG